MTVPKYTQNSKKMDNCTSNPICRLVDLILIISAIIGILLMTFGVYDDILKFGFRCKDPDINYKYNGDTVTYNELLFIGFIMPLIVICVFEYIMGYGLPYSKLNDRCCWIKRVCSTYASYFSGCLFLSLLVITLKSMISEPRPHFLHTCRPLQAVNCTIGEFILNFTCTNKNETAAIIRDSAQSFPSGHASLASYSSLFLIGYLNRKFKVASRTLLLFFQTLLLLLMVFVSISRITDRRHHWWDVLIGIIVGTSFSVFEIRKMKKQFIPDRPRGILLDETDFNHRSDVNHSNSRSFICNITNESSRNKDKLNI